MSGFDIVSHHRRRTREAERRAQSLEVQRAKLDRLLALAVSIAAGQDCEPLILLRALEELDRVAETSAPSTDRLVELLRETSPERAAP